MREGLMDDIGYQFDEYEPSEEDMENLIISIPREELDRIIKEEFDEYWMI